MSNQPVPYLYSILRLVPRVERGEALNIGLVMFCRPQRFLRIGFELDARRIAAFSCDVDIKSIAEQLETCRNIAAGDPAGGPIAALDIGERFHWLTNVSNTIIQPGPVHPGLTHDAEATFARLFAAFVAAVAPDT